MPADIVTASSIPSGRLAELLNGYDAALSSYLVSGFAEGFSTCCIGLPTGDTHCNLPSIEMAPEVVDAYIASERHAGRIAGPFYSNYSWIKKFSPIGLIPKKSPSTYRVIHHLSHPTGRSVNDFIPREFTAVQYGSVHDAVKLISAYPFPYLAKTDIANAFRIIPIQLADCPMLGFHWRGAAYVDISLPMGLASSSSIFQTFSDALIWIAQNKFSAGPMVSVLDDFLFVGANREDCLRALNVFRRMCEELHIPLRLDKTVDPCRSLTFLGVELDVVAQELRLPPAKVQRARAEVGSLLTRKKATLRAVQSCIGLLNFACVAVPLGRIFLRRMYDLCRGASRPHHRVTLTKAARLDLRAWQFLLSSFNGRSVLESRRWDREPGITLETDAAGSIGIGAVCGNAWLSGSWPDQLRDADICVKELIAVVIAISVWRIRYTDR